MKMLLKVAVPTTTVLAVNRNDQSKIAVFRSTGKHGNKLVLPGGRRKFTSDNHIQTGLREVEEELGIRLAIPHFFCISDKPGRDVRTVSIEKFADGNPIPEEFAGAQVETHHCIDISIWGVATSDELRADGEEGKEAFWYDMRDLNAEDFALDHGILVYHFREFRNGSRAPGLGEL